jgi:hypothetical protein
MNDLGGNSFDALIYCFQPLRHISPIGMALNI